MRLLLGIAGLGLAGLGIAGLGITAMAQAPVSMTFAPGPGQAQTVAACAACHAPAVVTGKHYSEDKWAEVVDQMVNKGAKVSDADYDTIVAYLARSYGVARPD